MRSTPKFRVNKKVDPPQVFLLCSECGADIRELSEHEGVDLRRGHYCKECDPGCIVLNQPKAKEEK